MIVLFGCNYQTKKTTYDYEVSEKAKAFCEKLPLHNPDSSFQMIREKVQDKQELRDIYHYLITSYSLSFEMDIAFRYFDYIAANTSPDDNFIQAVLLTFKGERYHDLGKIDSSILMIKTGIELAKKIEDSVSVSDGYLKLSYVYYDEQYNVAGTEACLNGIAYLPKIQTESLDELTLYLEKSLLLCYQRQRGMSFASKDLAIKLQKKEIALNNTMGIAASYITLATIFADLNQKDSALWAFDNFRKIYANYDNKEIKSKRMYPYVSEALVLKKCKEYDKTIAVCEKGKLVADSMQFRNEGIKLSYILGCLYLEKGELAKAESNYKEVLADKNFVQQKVLMQAFSDSLIALNLKKTNNKELLSYFYQSKRLKDTLGTNESRQTLADMQIRYQSEEKERKIHQLELEKQAKQLQLLFIAFLLLLLLSVGAWLYFHYRQKQILLAKENALLESDKKLLESSKELLEIRHKLQEQEINAHKAQLADFQENITNKNALIDEMQAQMNELLINATCITQSEAERNREKLDELKVLTEKDWRVYLTHFEKAYPGYIAKVEQHFPDLTKGELRFFLVIYLGLSKDELATFLGISLDGVNKNQYRLKKKLGLGEESSLREFIKKF